MIVRSDRAFTNGCYFVAAAFLMLYRTYTIENPFRKVDSYLATAALQRARKVCMLVPVHKPHFGFLKKRLDLTYRLFEGEPPHTVVIFDNESAISEYMTLNPEHRDNSKVHPLSLKSMVGETEFAQLVEFLQSASTADEYHTDSYSGCLKRTPGRVYQAIKKFYGPLFSPDFCHFFWVSDAESWPFRKFNFNELVQYSFIGNTTCMYQLVNSWHPRQDCAGATHDFHTDVSCSIMVQNALRFSGYWDERSESDHLLVKKLQQTMFDINNWWMYEREAIKHMHHLIKERLNTSLASTLVTFRISDIAFWTQYLQSLDSSSQSISPRNFPDEVKVAFPLAFAKCCACSSNQLPCIGLSTLFSSCFLAHVTIKQIGSFMVERLGIFGILGHEISGMPVDLFDAEKRISWVHNNADVWSKEHEEFVMG